MRARMASVGLAVVAAWASTAYADEGKEPEWKVQQRRKVLFDEGQKLVDKKMWKEALDKFREVERLKSHPRVMLWVALCEESLGNLLKARTIYAQAEASARQAKLQDVEEEATAAKEKLAPRISHLRVRITPAVEAEVVIDTTKAARPDGRNDVDPGNHTVVVAAAGRKTVHVDVTVRAGEEKVVDVSLPAVELPPAPLSPPPPVPESGIGTGPLLLIIGGGVVGVSGVVLLGMGYGGRDGFRAPGVGFAITGGLMLLGGGVWAGVSPGGQSSTARQTVVSSLSFSAAPTAGGAWMGVAGKF